VLKFSLFTRHKIDADHVEARRRAVSRVNWLTYRRPGGATCCACASRWRSRPERHRGRAGLHFDKTQHRPFQAIRSMSPGTSPRPAPRRHGVTLAPQIRKGRGFASMPVARCAATASFCPRCAQPTPSQPVSAPASPAASSSVVPWNTILNRISERRKSTYSESCHAIEVAAHLLALSTQHSAFPKWNQPVRLREFSVESSGLRASLQPGLV